MALRIWFVPKTSLHGNNINTQYSRWVVGLIRPCQDGHATVHERTLLVSISNGTCDEVLRHVKAKILCAYVSVGNYDAPVDFASYSFDAIMLFRAYLATAFAESSVKVVMIEADATWFRDPKHLFASEFSNEAVDIVAPRNGGISRGTIRAMSPMVIKPSNRTARFLKGLTRRLERLFDLSDQAVYNILCLSRYLGLRCGMFYYEDIADGVCSFMFDSHKYRFRDMMRPYIVNNNYIIGTLAKQERMSRNIESGIQQVGFLLRNVIENDCGWVDSYPKCLSGLALLSYKLSDISHSSPTEHQSGVLSVTRHDSDPAFEIDVYSSFHRSILRTVTKSGRIYV
ncbi:hypothetical protein RB195_015126 [Necator americanus]|uniref:Nucleotide-diphospho-sugar transferase domain-containing protein n=1 Tax=Necator americanus TaxID=51031 RepID=A0ABR1E354_NECAM